MSNHYIESVIESCYQQNTKKLNLSFEEKDRFFFKEMVPAVNQQNSDDGAYYYLIAMNRAVISMAQYFLEKDYNLAYDFIYKNSFYVRHSLDEVLRSFGFQGVSLVSLNEVFVNKDKQLNLNHITEILKYRVHNLYILEGFEHTKHYQAIQIPESYIHCLNLSLNNYSFNDLNTNIAKILLVSDFESLDKTFAQIANLPGCQYSYQQVLDLYLDFLMEFFLE